MVFNHIRVEPYNVAFYFPIKFDTSSQKPLTVQPENHDGWWYLYTVRISGGYGRSAKIMLTIIVITYTINI